VTPESSPGTLQEIITWAHLVIYWFSGTHLCMHVFGLVYLFIYSVTYVKLDMSITDYNLQHIL
jgi:hypothetical protein